MSSKSDDKEGKRTIRVRRRRRTDSSESEERARAVAPRRRRRDDRDTQPPAPHQPTGQTRPLSGSPISKLIIVALFLVVGVCGVLFTSLFGPLQSDEALPDFPTQVVDVSQTATRALPTSVPQSTPKATGTQPLQPIEAASGDQTWLVMLYQDADDRLLEYDIYVDLNEAERVGSDDRVHIVTQVDRYRAGYNGDGDWTATKRFYIKQDDDLESVNSPEVADLGEANMADGATLVDFVTWAIETYPADKHILVLSDHGMGWPGGWNDPAPGGRGEHDIALAASGDMLFLMELDEALEQIRAETGLERFELIGMDACLMGQMEVFDTLAPHARYAVASQETEPALGWAYTGFLSALKANPDMDGGDLARLIVDSYIEKDQRIVDEQARAELLRQGSPMGGLLDLFGAVSAEQLAQQIGDSITLSAVDLAAVPGLVDSLNDLAFRLTASDQSTVARARTYAQSFTSVFGRNVPPSYVDLGNLSQILKRESGDADVSDAADRLMKSLDEAVIAEKHGRQKPGATGISIYFPNSQLYASREAGPESYTAIARRFAAESLWDDFLAYHYTGQSFEPTRGDIALPEPGATVRGPGVGEIEVSPIVLSDDVVTPGQSVLLSTDIRGQNIGHIFLFTGFLDREAESIFVADMDYLESEDSREIDGVFYPDWGDDGAFTMELEWEPLMFAISDGETSALALFRPETYGASPEEAVYSVDGIYTYADGGESRHSRLYFSDGILTHVFGFTGEGGVGAPREIIPSTGDAFTVLERWLDLDARGQVQQVVAQEGHTLTFGDMLFTWQELYAAPGEYVVGITVEDLDGNSSEAYEVVSVE